MAVVVHVPPPKAAAPAGLLDSGDCPLALPFRPGALGCHAVGSPLSPPFPTLSRPPYLSSPSVPWQPGRQTGASATIPNPPGPDEHRDPLTRRGLELLPPLEGGRGNQKGGGRRRKRRFSRMETLRRRTGPLLTSPGYPCRSVRGLAPPVSVERCGQEQEGRSAVARAPGAAHLHRAVTRLLCLGSGSRAHLSQGPGAVRDSGRGPLCERCGF